MREAGGSPQPLVNHLPLFPQVKFYSNRAKSLPGCSALEDRCEEAKVEDGGSGGDALRERERQRRRWRWVRQGRDGLGQICAVHAGAGGGAGAGVRRVPQADLHAQAAAAPRVPHTVQHRAQADQGLVPEPKVSMSASALPFVVGWKLLH